MRGFGVTQFGFAYEVHMDTLAAKSAWTLEFRLKNMLVDNSTLPTGQVLETVTITECVNRAMELSGWRENLAKPQTLVWESEVKAL